MIAVASMVVYWHRYILLGELPKRAWLPSFQKLTFSYIWVLIKLLLLTLAILIPVGIFIVSLGSWLMHPTAGKAIFFGLNFFLNLIIYPYILRISITLPAVAIGKPMTFADALNSTQDIFREIIAAVFLMMILSYAFNFFIMSILPSLISIPSVLSLIGMGLFLLVNWISFMFGIGILTVIYGHAVENREL